MKRILQIFSVLLLSCVAVVLFGVLNPQKAHADPAACGNDYVAVASSGAIQYCGDWFVFDPVSSEKRTDELVFKNGLGFFMTTPSNVAVGPGVSSTVKFMLTNADFRVSKDVSAHHVENFKSEFKAGSKTYCSLLNPKTDCLIYDGTDIDYSSVLASEPRGGENTTLSGTHGLPQGKYTGKTISTAAFLSTVTGQLLNESSSSGDCVNNALSFFICPLYTFMQDFLAGTVKILDGLLQVPAFTATDSNGAKSGIAVAVSGMTTVANSAYVLLFLFIIMANFIAIPGLDNYTIKKLLPKLIFVIIITQFSFLLCSSMIDIGNILGKTIPTAITQGYQVGTGQGSTATNTNAVDFISTSLNPFTDVKTLVSSGLVDNKQIPIFAAASAGLYAISLIIVVVAVIILIIAAFYLAFRYLALAILTVLAPVALAAWVLPNTEGFTKWWITNFLKLVLLYPLIMIVLVASAIAADALKGTQSILAFLVAVVAPLVGLILIPKMLKVSGGLIASAGNALTQNKASQGGKSLAKSAAKTSAKEGKLADLKGKGYEKFGKALPGATGIKLQAQGKQLQRAPKEVAKGRIAGFSSLEKMKLLNNSDSKIKSAAQSAVRDKRRELDNTRVLDAQQAFDMAVLNGATLDNGGIVRDNSGNLTVASPDGNSRITADSKGVVSLDNTDRFVNPNFVNYNSGGGGNTPVAGGSAGAPSTAPTPGGAPSPAPVAPPTPAATPTPGSPAPAAGSPAIPPPFRPPTTPPGGTPPPTLPPDINIVT